MNNKYAIAIHGGAGTIDRESMNSELQKQYESGLKTALKAGFDILDKGGCSLDAVEAAVSSLEDCPLFNAGKGAVFNHIGKHEMDAAIMNGRDLSAGAVCGVNHVMNPVQLARLVMEKSGHVMLCGQGAEEFGKSIGVRFESDEYFYVAQRYEQLQDAIRADKVLLDHTQKKYGTVGAVALDVNGNLAAATSTGGLTNKKFGRVGDTPIVGAGTYANNNTCAVSCTGVGELFIRSVVAYDISCLIEYKGLSLQEACEIVVNDKLVKIGGEGGLIGIDKFGNISMSFNSTGMYRASKNSIGQEAVLIYRD
jgi:L-asparaginase / beta-aspartyl-peptidase